ncbi:MAG: DUF4292 domain-containing protein [Bacteroidetes bacterium]|nr:DUF4292 domain-containing protein [Bacteroidota bacterium]
MVQQKYLFGFLLLLATSCATFKKVQIIQDALSKSDTTKSEFVAEIKKVDSMAIVKNIVSKIAFAKLDYKTMNAKIKVEYESAKNADSYIANVSMIKDSQIYITIRGAMGVIGIKAFIKKDSVVLLYPLNKSKSVERKPISYLQEVVKIPFTFSTLQDLILGNPIFMDSTSIISYKSNNDKFQVSLIGRLFKNLVILNNDNSKVLHLKLDDVDVNQHRTCDISFSDHVNVGKYQFPLDRSISIVAQQKLDIHMEIKEFTFNEPVKYTFAIPKTGMHKMGKRK